MFYNVFVNKKGGFMSLKWQMSWRKPKEEGGWYWSKLKIEWEKEASNQAPESIWIGSKFNLEKITNKSEEEIKSFIRNECMEEALIVKIEVVKEEKSKKTKKEKMILSQY